MKLIGNSPRDVWNRKIGAFVGTLLFLFLCGALVIEFLSYLHSDFAGTYGAISYILLLIIAVIFATRMFLIVK